MDRAYQYYLVTAGPLLETLERFEQGRKESLVAAKALRTKYGADSAYGSHDGLQALGFETKPPGWVDAKIRGRTLYRPGSRHPDAEAILAEMRAIKVHDAHLLQDVVTGQDAYLMFMKELAYFCMGLEKIGDQYILMYPVAPAGGWNGGDAVWKVPTEGTELLTEARYYRMKADQAEKEAAAN